MKKISPLFLLSALFLSCASSGISYSKTPEPTESPVSTPSSSSAESSSSSEPSVSEETEEVYYHQFNQVDFGFNGYDTAADPLGVFQKGR